MELTITDYANLRQLLARSTFVGLEEAATGLNLHNKLTTKIVELQSAPADDKKEEA